MPRGLARDHAGKRAAIRDGAARYFASQGYDRASMAGVASACGVSKAALYHYYDGKAALLFDILETHLSALVAAAEAAPEGDLHALCAAILGAYEDADAEHKLQLDALALLPETDRAPLLDLQRRLVARMSQAVSAATGLEGAALKPVTMSAFGMLNWHYMWHRPGGALTRESYAAMVADLILGGVPRLG